MQETVLFGLTLILLLGISAQWLAWKLRLPAILLLLVVGFLAGPITGLVEPNELFGDILLPLISISVAIILYEGGLSLRYRDIREVGAIVVNLITIGVLVTWVLGTLLAHYLLGLEWPLATLLGAVLVVSGPTVIIPLLRHVRPKGRVGPLMKWEGIMNDPIGALLAVIVFEVILGAGAGNPAAIVAIGAARALLASTVLGLLGAGALILLFKHYLVPDYLQNPVSLMAVLGVFALSNHFQTESGLLAVTLMGIVLANQRWVDVKHIVDFKENLRVLLISGLFIVLAARVSVSELMAVLGPAEILFLLLLIVVVRPAAVFVSTVGSAITWKERAFLAAMAPRGIVAAAVISVFSLELIRVGYPGSESIVLVTFFVIAGTVAIYGLAAPVIARRLGLADLDPQGLLIVGANDFARALAKAVHDSGFPVVVVDSNWANISWSRGMGLKTYYGNVLSHDMLGEIDLVGIGSVMALTPNDEINSLAGLHFADLFNRADIYQLDEEGTSTEGKTPGRLRGRTLFSEGSSCLELQRRLTMGAVIKKTPITEEFTAEDFRALYGPNALPLLIIRDKKTLTLVTADKEPAPQAGTEIIALVDASRLEADPEPEP